VRTRKLATMVAGVAAVALLATACSSGNGSSGSSSNGGSTKVLTVGMPNGTLTENQNPLAPTGSASKSLGYAWVIYESLMQVNDVKPLAAREPHPVARRLGDVERHVHGGDGRRP
jgi:peptide/nickel transport system substrate-binding protein